MCSHHLPVGWMCCVKNSEIHLFFQCACFAPSQLGWRPMRAFVVDDFRYHIVCSDLKPNPGKAKNEFELALVIILKYCMDLSFLIVFLRIATYVLCNTTGFFRSKCIVDRI